MDSHFTHRLLSVCLQFTNHTLFGISVDFQMKRPVNTFSLDESLIALRVAMQITSPATAGLGPLQPRIFISDQPDHACSLVAFPTTQTGSLRTITSLRQLAPRLLGLFFLNRLNRLFHCLSRSRSRRGFFRFGLGERFFFFLFAPLFNDVLFGRLMERLGLLLAHAFDI